MPKAMLGPRGQSGKRQTAKFRTLHNKRRVHFNQMGKSKETRHPRAGEHVYIRPLVKYVRPMTGNSREEFAYFNQLVAALEQFMDEARQHTAAERLVGR